MAKCQQDALYDAEATTDRGRRFASRDEVQKFVDGLRETWWWDQWVTSYVKRVEVVVDRRLARSRAYYERDHLAGMITLSTDTPVIGTTVVHELAHIVAAGRRGSQSHDPWFARVYYELTFLIRGSHAGRELALAFDRYDVDYDAGGLT